MADANLVKFDKRMQKILKEHRKLSRGYITSVNHDGLVIARPKPRGTTTNVLRGVFLALLTLIAFKAFLFSHLGEAAYLERVAKLAEGTALERFGSYAMALDPVTLWLAQTVQGFFG